jgi:hypothetical protein
MSVDERLLLSLDAPHKAALFGDHSRMPESPFLPPGKGCLNHEEAPSISSDGFGFGLSLKETTTELTRHVVAAR